MLYFFKKRFGGEGGENNAKFVRFLKPLFPDVQIPTLGKCTKEHRH